jgi:cytochrome c oxidase cbb3-type subunit III
MDISEKRSTVRRSRFALSIVVLVMILAGVGGSARAQSKGEAPRLTTSAATAGKKVFSAHCAGCHGLDGSGGQRAPNIATNPSVRRLSDSDLSHVILNGRTDFGMPSFQTLGAAAVGEVVDYLRLLQGKGSGTVPVGNQQNGKVIFFGKAGCSSCHSIGGESAFTGSDLSSVRGIPPLELRKAIISPGPATSRARTAIAVALDGREFRGAVKNEDNFSIQLQGSDGVFYFLSKSDLAKLEYERLPSMPTDYGKRLSSQELDDLVGYLVTLKAEYEPVAEE